MTEAEDEQLLTTREVSEMFGVSARTVNRWVKSGLLPSIVTAAGHRFHPSDVARLAAASAARRPASSHVPQR